MLHMEILYDAGLVGLGAGLIIAGFSALRKKRMIQNVPTSKVRSVAMGFSEVAGLARQNTPLRSPLTNTTCVYYRYTIEKRVSSGRRQRWQTIEKGSSIEPFYVEDGTGKILVEPSGADAHLKLSYREIKRDGGLFSARRRYTEWRLADGEPAYVLGTVRKLRDLAQESRTALTERLRDLKRSPRQMAAFDGDRDGRISDEEWSGAVAVMKDEVLKEQVARQPARPEENLVLCKGAEEPTFVISSQGEKALLRKLNLQCAGLLAVGFALVVFCGASLLARAGLAPGGFAIDW